MTSPLDHVGRDEPVRPEALSHPRRRARSAVENVSAAAIAPPAVRRAYTAPEPRRARQLIEVSSTTAEEIGSSASFLPRVSIRLDQPDASGDDAGRRSRVSLVVRRRPQPGKVVTTTVSIDQRVVIFAALLSLAASAVGLPVSGGDAASQPPQVAGSGLHEFAETSWLDTRAAPQLDNVSLDSGISLLGQPWALDRLFARLTAGNPVTIGVLGASVAQNAGCLDQGKSRCMSYNGRKGAAKKGWAVRLLEAINATWPHASHRISNGALDATPVSTASSCLFSHLTEKVDLVLLEWGSMGLHNEAPMEMRHLEKVARALLSLAEPPLLLHISVREWCSQRVGPPRQLYTVGEMLYGRLRSRVYPDSPWWRVELEADRVSSYYGQAALSVHEAVYPRVLRKEPGFALADVTGDDCLHPANGRHGILFIAQLLERWLVQAHALWARAHSERVGALRPPKGLQPPLHGQNANVEQTRCYLAKPPRSSGGHGKSSAGLTWCSDPAGGGACALDQQQPTCPGKLQLSQPTYDAFMANPPAGWFYCPWSLAPKVRKPSAGIVALEPGASLLIVLNAYMARDGSLEEGRAASEGAGAPVTLKLTHLVSYEGMGVARLSCAGGCACPAHDIDAHQPEGEQGRRVSVFQEHAFEAAVVAEPACELLLVLQNRTSSQGHKFKMRGVKAVWERKAGAESEEGGDSADDAGPPGGHGATAGGRRGARRAAHGHYPSARLRLLRKF